MYRFALALALIVAAARPAAAVPITEPPTPAAIIDVCPPELSGCIVGDDSTCAIYEDTPKCCPVLPTGRRRRLNFGKSEPTVGCCQAECD